MLKRVFIIFIFHFTLAACASAVPIEGGNMPRVAFWKTGLQANTIFRVDMENPRGRISSTQYFLTGSLGITERICFDGKVGIGDITFDIKDSQKIEYPANFAGGYGGRVVIYDDKEGGLNCIMGFHHISVHPEYTKINNVKHEAIMDEWQASLMISKKILKLRPYAAGKFSKIYLIRKVDDARKRIKPEDSWGLILGADFDLNGNARLNIESRFFDEDSLTIGFNYTF